MGIRSVSEPDLAYVTIILFSEQSPQEWTLEVIKYIEFHLLFHGFFLSIPFSPIRWDSLITLDSRQSGGETEHITTLLIRLRIEHRLCFTARLKIREEFQIAPCHL